MAQPASNPKIEELRFRLKTDPKSRIFYPLAEELRKVSQYTEAEQVLRTGLANHPTYLSAWVSLGRVLRELGNNEEAVESLTKALQLDPGNVVAARILADAYLALGEKVEAIKKYKLVHALLPADQDLEAVIERLEKELHPPAPVPLESIVMPEAAPEQPPALDETPWAEAAPQQEPEPEPQPEPQAEPQSEPEPDIFAQAESEVAHEQQIEEETGDVIPMAATHAESPFEEPATDAGYSADAFAIEEPQAMHIEPAPLSAELPEPADVFAPAAEEPLVFPMTTELPPPAADDFAKTITMADLYAKQGLVDEARDIYEDILARDPNNESVRARLNELLPAPPPAEEQAPQSLHAILPSPPPGGGQGARSADEGAVVPPQQEKIARLEGWLAKVARR